MRLLELYSSVQGEGPNVGKPTTFVRFAGCNFRCPGWPCDTPYSIDPKIWRHEFKEATPLDIVTRVKDMYPHHVCITGGEPLLQPSDQMQDFIKWLREDGFTIDVFTNGSMDLDIIPRRDGVSIIMDWKLAGSGEGQSKLTQRIANVKKLGFHDAIKFVVKDEADLAEMRDLLFTLNRDSVPFRTYVSPAWDCIEASRVVEFLEEHKLATTYLNIQVHKYIWDPKARMI